MSLNIGKNLIFITAASYLRTNMNGFGWESCDSRRICVTKRQMVRWAIFCLRGWRLNVGQLTVQEKFCLRSIV